MQKDEEIKILQKEINDTHIEKDVSNKRNDTRQLLDLDKATKLNLTEKYFPEEPYSVSFIKDEDIIIYDAFPYEEIDTEKWIDQRIYYTTPPEILKTAIVNNQQIFYKEYQMNNRVWINALTTSKSKSNLIYLRISSPTLTKADILLKNYVIIRNE